MKYEPMSPYFIIEPFKEERGSFKMTISQEEQTRKGTIVAIPSDTEKIKVGDSVVYQVMGWGFSERGHKQIEEDGKTYHVVPRVNILSKIV